MWAFLGLPKPTPLQLDIAYNLQHAPDRFILEAFRGVGKSWITVAFVLWNLFLDPQKKIMVVSASQKNADDFSTFCKQLIHGMPLLQHLKALPNQRDSNVAFDVGPASPSKDASVKSVGITGQLTGSRADIIVPDDIEVPKNSQTHLLREKLVQLVAEFEALLKPGGRIIYLGTPQNESSIYNRLVDENGYSIRIWPVEIPSKIDSYKGRLALYVQRRIEAGWAPGTPLEPNRFGAEELEKRRLAYGRAGYALQFMLDTAPSDADRYPLKARDFIVSELDREMARVKLVWGAAREQVIQDLQCAGIAGDCYVRPAFEVPEMAKYTGTVMAIDPSGMGKDETAYAIVRYLYGMLFLVASGGFREGYSETTLNGLAAVALRHGVNYVIAEDNFGGGMFRQLLKPVLARHQGKAGAFDEEWKGWSSGQKELRILDTLEPIVQGHKLIVDRRVIEDDLKAEQPYSLIYQMTRLSRVRGALQHDDRIDALAMACSYWTDRMDRDTDKAHKQHTENLRDAELRKFVAHATGRKIAPLRYHNTRH